MKIHECRSQLLCIESVGPDTYRLLLESGVTLLSLEKSAKFCKAQRSLAKSGDYFDSSLDASPSASLLFALDFRMAATCSASVV